MVSAAFINFTAPYYKMKKLLVRALTGAVYVAVIVAVLVCCGSSGFSLLLSVFALLGMLEMLRMAKGTVGLHASTATLDILIGLSITSSVAFASSSPSTLWIIGAETAFLVMLRGVLQLYLHDANPVRDIALSALSIVYIAIPLAVAVFFRLFFGEWYMLLVFVMIWLNDTGAFLVGSRFGKHRLFERLSPKKSWEGFWGGFAFCLISGWLAWMLFPHAFGGQCWEYLVLGAIVSVFSTWGDLFESMIKRAVGVKDSGNILPGHGGMLDRIDSLLFVAPAAAVFFFLVTYI